MNFKIIASFLMVAAIGNQISPRQKESSREMEFGDYLFALICAMNFELGRNTGIPQINSNTPNQIATSILDEIRLQSDMSGPGWILDRGKYSNHPDWSYAGYTSIEALGCTLQSNCHPKKRPIRDIGHDVSHFVSKWSVFLDAISKISNSSANASYITELQSRLWNQIKLSVIDTNISDLPYVFRNYMDGSNGLYRWNYQNRGTEATYLPYEGTSAFYFSSISLLGCGKDCSPLFRTLALHSDRYMTSNLSKKAGHHLKNGKLFWELEARHSEGQHRIIDSVESYSFEQLISIINPSHRITNNCEGFGAYESIVGPKYFIMTQILESPENTLTKILDSSIEYCIQYSHPPKNTNDYYYMHRLLYELRWALTSSSRKPDAARIVYNNTNDFIKKHINKIDHHHRFYNWVNRDHLPAIQAPINR